MLVNNLIFLLFLVIFVSIFLHYRKNKYTEFIAITCALIGLSLLIIWINSNLFRKNIPINLNGIMRTKTQIVDLLGYL